MRLPPAHCLEHRNGVATAPPPDPMGDAEPEPPRCRACGEPLDLTQPSERRPGRLVGSCDGCGSLSVIDLDDPEEPYRVEAFIAGRAGAA